MFPNPEYIFATKEFSWLHLSFFLCLFSWFDICLYLQEKEAKVDAYYWFSEHLFLQKVFVYFVSIY